jgi:hypothetical protein
LTVLKKLAEVEALDRPPGLDRFLEALASTKTRQCSREIREELMRGPVCGCGFLPGQRPAKTEFDDPEQEIDRYIAEYLRILKDHRILESLASHAYALQDIDSKLSSRLKKIGSDLGSGTLSPSAAVKSFDETTIEELSRALSGRITLRKTSLEELSSRLAGRRLPPERILTLVSDWIGEPEKGVLISVEEAAGTSVSLREGALLEASRWWALIHTELFPNLVSEGEKSDRSLREMEEALEADFPSAKLAESMRSLDQASLIRFIASERFHTQAIRAAWHILIERILKGAGTLAPPSTGPSSVLPPEGASHGAPVSPSEATPTSMPETTWNSFHIHKKQAAEITGRLETAMELDRGSSLPFPERLTVRLLLERLLSDPWTDDKLQRIIFDFLGEVELLGETWMKQLEPVEPIQLDEVPLVVLVDGVSPDVWLKTSEQARLTGARGESSESWTRLDVEPVTVRATAGLFGFHGDPMDELAFRDIPYILLRGDERQSLADLVEPSGSSQAIVIRLSFLDRAAHGGMMRLSDMVERLLQLVEKELPALRKLCARQKRSLILTTDHGLSLRKGGLTHGEGGVYERAVFRARWSEWESRDERINE